MSMSVCPEATAFTRIPRGPRSRDRLTVKASNATLALPPEARHRHPRLAIRGEVVVGVVVDRIDRLRRDELLDRHHTGALDLDALHVLVSDDDVAVLAELVAFHRV